MNLRPTVPQVLPKRLLVYYHTYHNHWFGVEDESQLPTKIEATPFGVYELKLVGEFHSKTVLSLPDSDPESA